LNAELGDHLGYSKHEKISTDNSRNGFSSKTLQSDRNGDFEPQPVKKKQRRFTSVHQNRYHFDLSYCGAHEECSRHSLYVGLQPTPTEPCSNVLMLSVEL